jgi:hypothetical protein
MVQTIFGILVLSEIFKRKLLETLCAFFSHGFCISSDFRVAGIIAEHTSKDNHGRNPYGKTAASKSLRQPLEFFSSPKIQG